MEVNSKATVIDQQKVVPIEWILTHYFAPFLSSYIIWSSWKMQQKSPLCTYFFTVQQLKKKKSVNKLEFLHYAEAAQSDFKVSIRTVSS